MYLLYLLFTINLSEFLITAITIPTIVGIIGGYIAYIYAGPPNPDMNLSESLITAITIPNILA